MVYNITTFFLFKNTFQYQTAKFKNAKSQLLFYQHNSDLFEKTLMLVEIEGKKRG